MTLSEQNRALDLEALKAEVAKLGRHPDYALPFRLAWVPDAFAALIERAEGAPIVEADIPLICERGQRGEKLTAAEQAAWGGYELGWRDGREVALSQPPEKMAEGEAGLVAYIARYGGMCRACADEDGICPSSGLPCEGAHKAIRHVLTALRYGVSHGYVASPLSPPAPASENAVGAAEAEVGRYIYRRIERLMDAKPGTPEGAELDFLANIAVHVEEYGEEACADNAIGVFPAPAAEPVRMKLWCPSCGLQHIDEPSEGWDNPPHRSHLCLGCGHIWRPADVATVGVAEVATRGEFDSPILSKLGLSQVEGGWQPIETAPRREETSDPMDFILIAWTNRDGTQGVGEAYWYPGETMDSGWWWANTSPGDYHSDTVENSITGRITHWRPVPAPPQAEGGGA